MSKKTTIRFCGVSFTLETLDDEDFEQLYDEIIEHGSDLVERASTWSFQVFCDRRVKYQASLAENSRQLDLMDKEADRRKVVAA